MDNFPGFEFAKENGYTLTSYSGNRGQASYVKNFPTGGPIFLTCFSTGEAKLEIVFGIIRCSTGKFSLPNKNFHVFEKQIMSIYQEDWR